MYNNSSMLVNCLLNWRCRSCEQPPYAVNILSVNTGLTLSNELPGCPSFHVVWRRLDKSAGRSPSEAQYQTQEAYSFMYE